MGVLLGPADAGNYRVKVGRYGTRWYIDPLPGCDIAPASEWQGPSVSTTKPPFANKYVPMRAIADMGGDEWARLAGLTADARYEAIKTHDKLTGRVNMDRGTIVHRWAEDRLRGRAALFADPGGDPAALEQAERFRPALDAFFDAHQPEPVAVEVVCLHRDLNEVGYGGTADAFVRIEGDVWAIDWKSRNSDHGAYLEEAAQGGAYVGAQYMIVAGPDGAAVRVAVPDVAGVLIVSIRADGFRAFPIAADIAIDAYHEMHRWWVAQKRVQFGRPWAPKGETATPLAPVDDRRAALRARFESLGDTDRARFRALGVNPDDLDAIEAGLDSVDPFSGLDQSVPSVAPPVVTPERPVLVAVDNEGDRVDPQAFDLLRARFGALPATARSWLDAIGRDANRAGVEFHATGDDLRTERRFDLYVGLVTLAEHGHDDDDLVREIAATALDTDAAFHPIFTLGHVVGAMGADEAATFSRLCAALCADVASVDLRSRPAA